MTRRAVWTAASLLMAVALALLMLASELSSNIVYFRTASEAAADLADEPDTNRFRVAGAVVPGSVVRTPEGVRFTLTDGVANVEVHHHGDPPELFETGVPVVTEGQWDGTRFRSDRLMIKHGSEYRPPEVSATAVSLPAPRGGRGSP